MFLLPLSPAVREVRQQTLGKTLTLVAGLQAAWPVSLCLFAPLGLLPPATRLSRLAVRRAREAAAVELLLARSPLSDLAQTSLEPAALERLLPVWETLVRRSAWAAERKEEERKLVLLQAGAVRARGVMQLACELSRFVAGREASLHELLQNVFVFWNSEKEKKFGYLTLTQLCLECAPQLLRGVTLLPESQRVRYCDFSLRDKEGVAVKFAMQGTLRMYKATPGTTLSVIYVVSDEVKKPGTVHQVYASREGCMHSFLCGLDAEKQMKVLDGTTSQTLDGVGVAESLSVTISASCRKHGVVLSFEKPNCIFLYDCLFNNRFKTCFWSGRAACIICECSVCLSISVVVVQEDHQQHKYTSERRKRGWNRSGGGRFFR